MTKMYSSAPMQDVSIHYRKNVATRGITCEDVMVHNLGSGLFG